MATYISLLRGVNMTGHNSIKMVDLSALFINLGYSDVTTYIQSGNVIFTGPDDMNITDAAINIEKAIHEKFGYNIPAIIKTIDELKKIIFTNPYHDEASSNPSKMAVLFLTKEPSDEQLRKVDLIDYPPDKFEISGKEIYIYCPNGFGKTKLYTNFFEKKMGVIGTARNWKSVVTIYDLSMKR